MRIYLAFFLFAATAAAQLKITTTTAPVATQYQSYNTTLAATGGMPPYTWSVVTTSNVGLPEGMSLNPATGVVSAPQVNGQGGYQVTIQVTDSSLPTPSVATAPVNFGVNSDTSLGGCQIFPPDSIYNQRVDQLPVDINPAHQIPASYLTAPIHPDFGHGFYPFPGGIPWMKVPANQPTTKVVIGSGQIEAAGTYNWPFPAWPNALVEGTSYGADGGDHHTLILQSSVSNLSGPQTGPCTLYETYQSNSVASMFTATTNTWTMSSGAHYVLNSNQLASSPDALDQGSQDSAGVPMMPLLLRYSEVPMQAQHPLRMTFPSPTNWFVWPATGCCTGNGPPQGLLYRLKASVNWQATCPVSANPQAATVLQALQQYGAYMSDHGSAGYIQGVPDVRWDDDDLACIKKFHVSDLEVVDNSILEVSPTSGQTQPFIVRSTLPAASIGSAYNATVGAAGGNPATRQIAVSSGALPPGLTLDGKTGIISGSVGAASANLYLFSITATDTASGLSSAPQAFVIGVTGASSPVSISDLINSASLTGGPIAPGELVTLRGTLLGPAVGVSFSTNPIANTLGGTQVFFGAEAAPLLYSSASQINAVVPWSVAGQSAVTILVQSPAGSTSLNTPVAAAAPGVFTYNSSGAGQAIVINQDGTPNGSGNPAVAGSYVSLYFTGGGVTNPPGLTGAVNDLVVTTLAASAFTKASVGGVPGVVTYAGSAPGFVGGVNQMNILMSANTPSGNQPITITIAGQSSTATATVAIK